jgi:hypothetical protein
MPDARSFRAQERLYSDIARQMSDEEARRVFLAASERSRNEAEQREREQQARLKSTTQ